MKIELTQPEATWILRLLRDYMDKMEGYDTGYDHKAMDNLKKLESKLEKIK